MKVVYVGGPYRGANAWEIAENIRASERLALQVWEAGAVAISPHLNTMHFQGALPDHRWLEGDLEILRRCDAIILVPGWQRSEGTKAEKAFAEERGLKVFYAPWEVERWVKEEGQ